MVVKVVVIIYVFHKIQAECVMCNHKTSQNCIHKKLCLPTRGLNHAASQFISCDPEGPTERRKNFSKCKVLIFFPAEPQRLKELRQQSDKSE